MNNQNKEPRFYYLDSVYLSEIVLDDCELITLFGYMIDRETHKPVSWTFFSNLSQLTDLLVAVGEKGEPIIEEVSTTLSEPYKRPTIVKIADCLNESLLLDSFVLKTYFPSAPNEQGEIINTTENWLYIDAIEQKESFLKNQERSIYFSYVKHGKLIGDLLDEALSCLNTSDYSLQLTEYLELLDKSFKTYKELIHKGFSTKKARKSAGLQNELLYRIAFANHQCLNN